MQSFSKQDGFVTAVACSSSVEPVASKMLTSVGGLHNCSAQAAEYPAPSMVLLGESFVKRFALCCRTVVYPVCLYVLSCNVGVLWPNGWMD